MTSDDSRESRLRHLVACGVPELEAEVVAEGVNETEATRAVKTFCQSDKTFCLLMGGAGSGKSIAAAGALLNSKMSWGDGSSWSYSPTEARYTLAADLAVLGGFDLPSQKILDRAERYRWLIIDDLGSELATDVWRANLGQLILARNSARRRTIITTNLTIEAFKARYDERIVSRIRGNGLVSVTGSEDMRRSQGALKLEQVIPIKRSSS